VSITKRLAIAFSVFVVALITTGVSALVLLSHSQSRFEYMQDHAVASILVLDSEIREANELRADLFRHLLTADTTLHEQLERRIDQRLKSLEQTLKSYGRLAQEGSGDASANAANLTVLAEIKRALPKFIDDSDAGYTSDGSKALSDSGTVGKGINALIAGLIAQIELNTRVGEQLRSDNGSAYRGTVWFMVICIGAVVGAAGLFAIRTIVLVKSSLANIETSLRTVSTTFDLTSEARVDRRDEIGRTALAFNSLLAGVANALRSVVDSAEHVSSAARKIASGNVDLSARTEQQAASLQETAASMNELTMTVAQNAENAQHGRRLAAAAQENADAGNAVVGEMISTMSEISSSSVKVSEITGLIEGIAFQTNILALNAAVEAARAGQNGKGFAVVASEVRSLAQRSAEAAKEIKQLIGMSAGLVDSGSRLAIDAGATMQRVTDSISQVASIMAEIATASEEQRQGIEQVNQAVSHMDKVTQHNAALVDEAANATGSLEHQAHSLRDAVSIFKVRTEP
jgi:methyl-accepting chemotaxis protein